MTLLFHILEICILVTTINVKKKDFVYVLVKKEILRNSL